jgi:hypothetical protein
VAILDDTRADWNARPPLRTRTAVPWSDRIGVSWHWIGPGKGPSATGPHSACLAQVRDWQAMHQANGWKDIGYNALICQHARAIEGRGLVYSGSHSPGVNYEHVGIQFMVGSGSGFPSKAMIARAVQLRADVGALGKNIRRDWPHREDPKASTECPGDGIASWVHSGGPTLKVVTGTGGTTAPPPKPPTLPTPKPTTSLVVDGNLGPATIKRWQKVMGTPVDGVISRPSELIRAVQRRLNPSARLVVDGKFGPATIRALQRHLGTEPDGVISHPSEAVRALQRRLNLGRF